MLYGNPPFMVTNDKEATKEKIKVAEISFPDDIEVTPRTKAFIQ